MLDVISGGVVLSVALCEQGTISPITREITPVGRMPNKS